MDALEKHISQMVDFYKGGIKEKSQKLGIELEYTLVKEDDTQLSYHDEFGQKWLMDQMKDEYPDDILDEAGHQIGIANERDTITLEPAGQYEISAGPFTEIADVKAALSHLISRVEQLESPHGNKLLAIGYHPKVKAEDLVIIPKVRYGLMNRYFYENSPKGIRMMRATGSTQISIDYCSVEDCLRKLRLAYFCVPVFALLCDNTPYFEGAPRTHYLMRTEVWEDCDARRCGLVPGVLSKDFTLQDYARHVLTTRAMFEMDLDLPTGHMTEKTTSEVYGDKDMDRAACANASSHLFNDIRLKNFIEIRPADALPLDYAVSYAALVKGLFYKEESLDAMEALFEGFGESDFLAAKASFEQKGFEGEAYGKSAQDICLALLKIANAGLAPDEQSYLSPLQEVADTKTTLADKVVPLS